jgi:ribosomal protein S27AE
MTNTNCLQGIECPKCGNDSKFIIAVGTLAEVTDDGAETFGNLEWDDASFTECPDCGQCGVLAEFRNLSDQETATQTREE